MTDDNGNYSFTNLSGGKYTITETQPATMFDGIDVVGTQGGTLGNDVISNIVLDAGEEGTGNNFGELGLDSLLGLRFARKIGELTDVETDLEWILDYPTVRELSGFLEQRAGATA